MANASRALAFLAITAVASSQARAQSASCPLPEGAAPSLAEVGTEARLGFIRERLERDAVPARRWTWGWAIGYAVVGAAQLSTAHLFNESGRRTDFYVGGIRSLIASAAALILPTTAPREHRRLERRLASRPVVDCALLAEAEAGLARAAASERRGKSWTKHAMVFGYNAIFALILGLGYDRWPSAAISMGTGMLAGELMILTQPTRARRDWGKYLAAELAPAPPPVSWMIVPTLGAGSAGAALVVTF